MTGNVVLREDITGCAGDGLIVGAANTRINLNGHTIAGTKVVGRAGIRINGHNDVRIESTAPFGAIIEFGVGIRANNTRRLTLTGVTTQAVVHGLQLEHSGQAMIRNNNLGFAELVPHCEPDTAPAGIRLVASHGNTIRNNAAQLTGYGILLIRSNDNTLRGNGAAPDGSDGNVCSGVSLVSSNRNLIVGNIATENRGGSSRAGDGIFVDAASTTNTVKGNSASTNSDDGLDVRNATTRIVNNTANDNDDLGIEAVAGVAATGNKASGNSNPIQCLNVVCT